MPADTTASKESPLADEAALEGQEIVKSTSTAAAAAETPGSSGVTASVARMLRSAIEELQRQRDAGGLTEMILLELVGVSEDLKQLIDDAFETLPRAEPEQA